MEPPIVLIAIANDQITHGGYLRNLSKEYDEIEALLNNPVVRQLCEVVTCYNATISKIVKAFQEYGDRVVLFHFAGHAQEEGLFLETKDQTLEQLNHTSLASFLGRRNDLKIVFLNACLTQATAEALNQAGVPLVIGTQMEVSDLIAAELARLFYSGISNGLDVKSAWADAEDVLKNASQNGGTYNYRGLYRKKLPYAPQQFPWKQYIRPGAEDILHWNLPKEAQNPLFGLPAINDEYYYRLPEAPYLGLQTFRKKHAALFFGRGAAIRELYNKLKGSAPIILYSGPSGVGKSSLLEAGLIPRLEQEYRIHTLRREGLLRETLLKGLGYDITLGNLVDVPVLHLWLGQEATAHKPSLLLFDQLEEVYTKPSKMGPEKELEAFTQALSQVFDDPTQRPQGKIILAYREEYSARIEQFLRLHQLPYITVFLTPLNRAGMIEAIQGIDKHPETKNKYDLRFEDRVEDLIADGLSADAQSSQAPVLQILLERMWKAAKLAGRIPVFSEKLYTDLKKKGYLLDAFLKQQLQALEKAQPETVQSGLVLDILFYFTTTLSTAETRTNAEVFTRYAHRRDVMETLLLAMIELRLLQPVGEDKLKLSHDLLAPLIRKIYEESGLPGQLASRVLANKAGMSEAVLDDVDLKMVEAGMGGRQKSSEAEQKLIKESKNEQLKRQRAVRNRWALGILAVVTAILAVFLWWEKERLRIANTSSLLLAKAREVATEDFSHAVGLLREAYDLHKGAPPLEVSQEMGELIYNHKQHLIGITEVQHQGEVIGAKMNSDGQLLLSWGVEPYIKLCTREGKVLVDTVSHRNRGKGALFCEKQKAIVSWGHDGVIKLWEYSGKRRQIHKDSSSIMGATLNHDGMKALYWTWDGQVKLWDLKTGKNIDSIRYEGFNRWVENAILHPNESEILSWSVDGEYRLWNYLDKTKVITSKKLKGRPLGAVFSPDGENILSWSEGGYIYWRRDGKILDELPLNKQELTGASISEKDGSIFAWTTGGRIYQNKKLLISFEQLGELNRIRKKHIAINVANERILTWTSSGVKVYDFKGALKADIPVAYLSNAKWGTDGKNNVITYNELGQVQIWDLNTTLIAQTKQKGAVLGTEFDDKSEAFLSWTYSGSVRLWSLDKASFKSVTLQKERYNLIYLMASNHVIGWRSDTPLLKIWTLQGKLVQTKQPIGVYYVEVTDDGKRIVLYMKDMLELYDLQTGKLIQSKKKEKNQRVNWNRYPVIEKSNLNTIYLNVEEETVEVVMSQDQRFWVSWKSDGDTVSLWDRANHLIARLPHNDDIVKARFNKDGQYIATTSSDGCTKVWNLKGEEVNRIQYDTAAETFDIGRKGAILSWKTEESRWATLNVTLPYTKTLVDTKYNTLPESTKFSTDERYILSVFLEAGSSAIIESWPLPETYYLWLKKHRLGELPAGVMKKYLE